MYFNRPYALKIKYPMIVSFSHTYLQATMCKIQRLYCIIVIRAWFRLVVSHRLFYSCGLSVLATE